MFCVLIRIALEYREHTSIVQKIEEKSLNYCQLLPELAPWLTLSGSNYPWRIIFYGPKDVRVIEVRLACLVPLSTYLKKSLFSTDRGLSAPVVAVIFFYIYNNDLDVVLQCQVLPVSNGKFRTKEIRLPVFRHGWNGRFSMPCKLWHWKCWPVLFPQKNRRTACFSYSHISG